MTAAASRMVRPPGRVRFSGTSRYPQRAVARASIGSGVLGQGPGTKRAPAAGAGPVGAGVGGRGWVVRRRPAWGRGPSGGRERPRRPAPRAGSGAVACDPVPLPMPIGGCPAGRRRGGVGGTRTINATGTRAVPLRRARGPDGPCRAVALTMGGLPAGPEGDRQPRAAHRGDPAATSTCGGGVRVTRPGRTRPAVRRVVRRSSELRPVERGPGPALGQEPLDGRAEVVARRFPAPGTDRCYDATARLRAR